jgi:hypothetical protein
MQKQIGQFVARGHDGQDYVIEIYVDQMDTETRDDLISQKDGFRSLQTEGGLSVRRLSKGEYLIVRTGLRLHSESPDAP